MRIYFLYNLIFALPNVLPTINNNLFTFMLVSIRFLVVTVGSLFVLWFIKNLILKINSDSNTRKFIGV